MPEKLIREIPLIKRYSRHNENEDWSFRAFLKGNSRLSAEKIDREVEALTEEIWKEIDCTTCANCCKTLQIVIDDHDIARLALHLKLNVAQFTEKYVVREPDGVKLFKSSPCPLLGEDNRCTVYDVRPQACRDFPFLHEKEFSSRSISMIENCATCPIVFNVWNQLKFKVGFKRKK